MTLIVNLSLICFLLNPGPVGDLEGPLWLKLSREVCYSCICSLFQVCLLRELCTWGCYKWHLSISGAAYMCTYAMYVAPIGGSGVYTNYPFIFITTGNITLVAVVVTPWPSWCVPYNSSGSVAVELHSYTFTMFKTSCLEYHASKLETALIVRTSDFSEARTHNWGWMDDLMHVVLCVKQTPNSIMLHFNETCLDLTEFDLTVDTRRLLAVAVICYMLCCNYFFG